MVAGVDDLVGGGGVDLRGEGREVFDGGRPHLEVFLVLSFEERLINARELPEAAEAFYTSASAFVMPVVEIDGVRLGDGTPGPVTRRLQQLFFGLFDGTTPDTRGWLDYI